jgi:asparagine synthase (glutamine-hydrolysing)
MCGIAGYIGFAPPPKERLESCFARMRHRGPDGRGEYSFNLADGRVLCLLHTRLAIIDRKVRSDQPLRDGKLVIANNGEIYNYIEIRAKLASLGETFATDGDTEVLAKAINRWGIGALDQCEGMWAFAAFDETSETLWLCRDRFGEKPLYLYKTDDGVYFGSEVKFIAHLLGHRLSLNHRHLRRFLAMGYRSVIRNDETFFLGLERMPTGSFLEFSSTEKFGKSQTYWRAEFRPRQDMSRDEAVVLVRESLMEAVGMRLRSDTPLAFCLSGGVDSNSLLAIASRIHGFDAHCFTIVNTDSRYEEAEMVNRTVTELGVRHTSIPLEKKGFLSRLRDLVMAHDAPVATLTFYLHSLLMRSMADDGYRVVISGTGADELFTGYYDHHLAFFREVRGDEKLHQMALEGWLKRVAPVITNPHLRDPGLFVNNPGFRDHLGGDNPEISSLLCQEWDEAFAEEDYCSDLLRNRMLNELRHETVPLYLHEEDLNAMAVSVENRAPFLDRRLCELCYTIPTRFMIKDGFAKSILRDAMRGIVPDPIVDNPRKVGFNAPILDLLDVEDEAVKAELLADSPLFEIIDRAALAKMLAPAALPNSASKLLFSLVSVKFFLEKFS